VDGRPPEDGRLLLKTEDDSARSRLVGWSERKRLIELTAIVGTGVDFGDGIVSVDALSVKSLARAAAWFSALLSKDKF
jgi:hypothetical protein